MRIFSGIFLVSILVYFLACVGQARPEKQGLSDKSNVNVMNDLLKILPERLRDITLPTEEDIHNLDEKKEFKRGGYCFEVEQDFDNDGDSERAVVGLYKDNVSRYHPFVCVFSYSVSGNTLRFFHKFSEEKFLFIKKPDAHDAAFLLVSTTLGTDFFYQIKWDGSQFILEQTPEDLP